MSLLAAAVLMVVGAELAVAGVAKLAWPLRFRQPLPRLLPAWSQPPILALVAATEVTVGAGMVALWPFRPLVVTGAGLYAVFATVHTVHARQHTTSPCGCGVRLADTAKQAALVCAGKSLVLVAMCITAPPVRNVWLSAALSAIAVGLAATLFVRGRGGMAADV